MTDDQTEAATGAENLHYPKHFLHDIENMSAADQADRLQFLISWAKRHARGHANPKWVLAHMYELAALSEIQTARIAAIEAENKELREALEKIASRTQSSGLLWWQETARAALTTKAKP